MAITDPKHNLPIGWTVDQLGYVVSIKEDDDEAVKNNPVIIAGEINIVPSDAKLDWAEEESEADFVVSAPVEKVKSKFAKGGYIIDEPTNWVKETYNSAPYVVTSSWPTTWATTSTADIASLKNLLGTYQQVPNWSDVSADLQVADDSASVEGMATPTLIPLPDSAQSTLPRTYKHPGTNNYDVCTTGESIWIKDSAALVLQPLYGKHVVISPEGKYKHIKKRFSEKKALKAGWTKVAEGPSTQLPKLAVVEILPTALFLTSKKFSDLSKSEFIDVAKNIVEKIAGPYSICAKQYFEHSAIREAFNNAYQSLVAGKEHFNDKLTPSEKGKLTMILNQVNYLYLLAELWNRYYTAYYITDTDFEFSVVDEAIVDMYDKIMSNAYVYTPYHKHMDLQVRLEKQRHLLKYPINPYKADYKDLCEFAKTINVKYLELFDEDELRNWVASNINWPGASKKMAQKVEETIEIKFLMSKVVGKPHLKKDDDSLIPSALDFKAHYQEMPSVSGSQTIAVNGYEFVVDHLSLVSLGPGGEVRVYKGSYYYKVINGEKSDPKELWCAASKAHAIDISAGWEDISPKWNTLKYFPAQPSNVDDDIISFILNCEYGGKEFAEFLGDTWLKKSDAEIESWIYDAEALDADQCLRILAAKESIRKLIAWALYVRDYNPSSSFQAKKAESLIAAIRYLAKIGAFIHTDTNIWNCSELGKDFVVPPDGKIYQVLDYAPSSYLIRVNEKSYLLPLDTGVLKRFPYDLAGYKKVLVFTAPPNLALDKAHAEGWEFTEEIFNKVVVAETQDWNLELAEKAAAYYFKLAIGDNETYAGLVNKIYAFPSGIKQLVVLAAQESDFAALDVVLWKVSKGAYASGLLEEKIDPTAPYYPLIKKGIIGVEEITNNWPSSIVIKFLDDFHVVISPTASFPEMAAAVAAKLLEIKKAAAISSISDASLDTANLQLTPISLSFGGMHTKQAYADQFGNTWMAKFYASDPNAQYRCDAEHYGNVIGRTLGFNSVLTFVRVIDGNYNVLQRIEPNSGTLKSIALNNLNLSQLISLMEEHVLDWLISNHDSWGDNLLIHPNGKEIIGIDKGQAFKHCHDDELAVGYLPRENPIPVLYDQFYEGIVSGFISSEIALKVATRVLLKAYQVKTRQNERIQSLVEAALSKRSKWPENHDKDSYAKLIMNRKASILDDFVGLYKKLFAQAGIEWTIDVESFGKNVGDAFIANSPIFADAVRNATAYGISLLFNSRDLEDTHLVFTPMMQKGGGTCLLGSAKIRQTADTALTAWLKARLNEKVVLEKKQADTTISNELPYLNMFVTALVHLIKTVKTHKEDGNYNDEAISNAEMYKNTIQNIITEIEESREDNPLKCLDHFSTLEQQNAWAAEATILLSYYDIILEAKKAKKSVSEYCPSFPKLEFPTYTPTKNLTHKSASKLTLYDIDGGIYGSTSDGGFVAKENDKYVWFDKKEFELTVPNDAISLPATDSGESEQDVQIAGKQMQVARRKAAQHGGKMDLETGKLVEHAQSSHIFQTGYEYTVTYDDVKIYYRPWKEEGVYAAQQGQLGFEIRNWDGGYEAIDDVLDTLGLMGIDVTPADILSLELFYWRQITSIIADRMDTIAINKIIKYVSDNLPVNSKLSDEQELNILKEAWSKAYSQEIVEKAKWFPRFHKYLGIIGGRPFWFRPDFTIEQLRGMYSKYLPSHVISTSSTSASNLILSGALLSTEERPRLLGLSIQGASSSADQEKGSSAFVFLRQNIKATPSGSHPLLILDPTVALRTTTYAFHTDFYGSLNHRKTSAPFDPLEMYKFHSDSNEMMVKNGAPVMLVVVWDDQQRSSLIKALTDAGRTELEGRPLEECILDRATYEANRADYHDKLWEYIINRELELHADK